MDPLKLIARGIPLQIEIAPDNYRLIAALTQHPDGWMFADIRWCDPLCSFHPFHLVPGEITGDDPWQIGPYRMLRVRPGPAWGAWQEYAENNGACDQASAELAIREHYHLDRETGSAS